MRIGIDLGGTKIEVIALDDHGATLLRHRVPTSSGDYPGTVNAIADLVLSTEQKLGQTASVGIGIPGTISPRSGLVKNSNSLALIGNTLDKDIADKLRRPVRLQNDANCFALSEAVDGAAAGARTVFGAILGTGCGGGMVIDGKVIEGRNKIAGEWGHTPLPWMRRDEWPGVRCYCGKLGCLETFLSGAGLAREHQGRIGLLLMAEEISTAAKAGDEAARDSLG